MVILQRARHDLRSRCRPAIDENDDGLALGKITRSRKGTLRLLRVAALGHHDGPLFQKVIGNGNRLIEQAPRIIAQVNDVASNLAYLLLERGDFSHEVGMRRFAEAGDLDIDDIPLTAGLDRINTNDVTNDRYVERLVVRLAGDPERNWSVWRTAHLIYRLVKAEPYGVRTVDGNDDVVGLQAGLGRRCVVNG